MNFEAVYLALDSPSQTKVKTQIELCLDSSLSWVTYLDKFFQDIIMISQTQFYFPVNQIKLPRESTGAMKWKLTYQLLVLVLPSNLLLVLDWYYLSKFLVLTKYW